MSKAIFYFLGIALIILTILFFWNELGDISFTKKINSDKIADYFTSIGAIATVLTLFFIYSQLVEINEDRKASVFPDLHPENARLVTLDKTVQMLPSTESLFDGPVKVTHASFHSFDEALWNTIDYNKKPEAVIALLNIGKGPAKNIEIIWLYDFEAVKKLILPIYDDKLTVNYLKEEPEKFSILAQEKGTTFNLPRGYMNCCGKQLNETNDHKPELGLLISYDNLFGNKIKKEFHVEIKLHGSCWVDFVFVPKISD